MLWVFGLWVFFLCEPTFSTNDAEVSCQLGQSCILPCSFPPGDDLVITWIQLTPKLARVHSYYKNKDHWVHQDQRFRGRTSLFKDQISKGNASLQLTGVMVQDEGPYQCQTSTVTDENTSLLTVWIVFDAEVSCQFGQSCILPCSFPPGDDLVIHWNHLTTTLAKVHSYYDNKDQLEDQHQRFRGRTSLFQDQISKGNASLQLTGVMVQDEGPYRCLTSTINETGKFYINMTVYAPPQKINMKQTENQIICSSDGIYPQPDLSWSISPPSSRTFQNTTRVQKTEELLYNISSSLTLSDGEDDLDYICTISTPSNQRRASWRRGSSVKIISGEATISCSASDSSLKGFSLVWSFNQNQMIVTKKEDDEQRVSEEWKQHVKDVSESGRLTLQHLSADHEGTYTCEVSKDEETNITQVSLSPAEESNNPHVTIIIVLTVIGITAVVIALVFFCRRRRKATRSQNSRPTDNGTNRNNEEQSRTDLRIPHQQTMEQSVLIRNNQEQQEEETTL